MPYGGNSYGAIPYGGDLGQASGTVPTLTAGSGGWWFVGPAARMLADAGFLLLVKPRLDERERAKKGESETP